MKKKIVKIITLATMSLFLTSCSNKQEQNIVINQKEIIQCTNFDEKETLKEKLIIEEFKIRIPENASVNSFCVYENMVYYSVEFGDYLLGPKQIGKEEIPFEDKYNTQIRAFDTETKEDNMVYRYSAKECIGVSDIQCNGKELVWEEYQNGTWNIKLFLLGEPQKEPILKSPYEHINIHDGVKSVCTEKENNINMIQLSDNLDILNLEIDMDVSAPIANKQLCIWMKGYDYHERQELYCFDREKQTTYCIPTSYTFAYEVLDNMILLNQEDEIICYNVKTMEKTTLTEGKRGYGFLFSGIEGNVYAEIFDEEKEDGTLNIINIKTIYDKGLGLRK